MIKVLNGRLWQWDTGRQVKIRLPDNIALKEVQFYNNTTPNALVVKPNENIADIPNILLQSHENLTVYVVVTNETGEQTKVSAVFGVNKRPKPDDYIYTEAEIYTVKAEVEKALSEAKESGAFDGEQGPQGEKGEPGDDYILTDADKTEIAKKIVSPTVAIENDTLILTDTAMKTETEILDDVLVLR